MSTEFATAGIQQLQQAMASGALTSVALTRAYLARIGDLSVHGPHLNAVRALDPAALGLAATADAERAAGIVRGVLHGIPLLLKDNIDVLGMPTTAGSLALADSHPAADAPLVTGLTSAGAVVLGKTNLTEFANWTSEGMPSGYSSLGGQVINPYDASRTPSGSSAGSAVAAAVALAAATVGTETSGSILSPAQACSVVGVKPTVGLISRSGVVPISATQDTPGPMTRSVWDAAAVLTALAGTDPRDPATADNPLADVDFTAGLTGRALRGARLGVVADDDPVFAAALTVLRARGATLVEVSVEAPTAEAILRYEFARDLDAHLARLPAGSPVTSLAEVIAYNEAHAAAALKFGQTLLTASAAVDLADPDTLATYMAAREQGLAQARAAIDSVLVAHHLDAVVSASATTVVGARAGYPSVSVPAGYAAADRAPVALTLLGARWSEPRLLALAHDYEQAARVRRSPEEINPSLFARTRL